MKNTLSATLLGCLIALTPLSAAAHGSAEPKHGGIVQTASDLSFELVGTAEGADIYVEDHGKPFNPNGMSGKLTVLMGAEKTEAALAATSDRLQAKGVKLGKGAKVVAVVNTANKKVVTVRFTVR